LVVLAAIVSGGAAPVVNGGASAANFPAPRISEAYTKQLRTLPDWNGDWYFEGGLMFDPANQVLAKDDGDGFYTGPPPGSYVKNIPYKPEYQKQYDETVKKAVEGIVTDPVGDCRQPHGMPREMGGAPRGAEITMTPTKMIMTWDWFNATRRVFIDGRPHIGEDDLVPTYMGHSIGKWEGDTLVVDTIGMIEGIFDRSGSPHSDQVHLTERMRLIGPDRLEIQMTIEDPVMFTRPWKVTRTMVRRPEDKKQNRGSYCEGTRVDMSSGVQRLELPGDALAGNGTAK
jgi:hypothetical protein